MIYTYLKITLPNTFDKNCMPTIYGLNVEMYYENYNEYQVTKV